MSKVDKQSPLYEPGVSCPACHDQRSEEQRASYRERQRQQKIAAEQGRVHVGNVLTKMKPEASDG